MSLDPQPTHGAATRPARGHRASVSAAQAPRADASALWDIDEVAAYLGVAKQTIYTWRTTGYGPAGFRVGKHLRWRPSTVIAWTVHLEELQ